MATIEKNEVKKEKKTLVVCSLRKYYIQIIRLYLISVAELAI